MAALLKASSLVLVKGTVMVLEHGKHQPVEPTLLLALKATGEAKQLKSGSFAVEVLEMERAYLFRDDVRKHLGLDVAKTA